jgi:hypothetical protein
MGQLALFDSLRTVLSLAAAALLFWVDGDRMISYATFVLAAGAVRSVGMILVTLWRFPESRPRPSRFHTAELSRVSRFAGWAIVANAGKQIYSQVTVVMLGIAYDPLVTAAYAIAVRVGGYHANFSGVLPKVMQPAMTSLEARGERRHVQAMTLMTGKYGAAGVLFLVIPLLIETEGILRLWLVDVPDHAVLFVRLAMIWHTVLVLTSGFETAIYAYGNIRAFALTSVAVWAVSLAIGGFLIFVLQLDPWVLPVTVLAAVLAQVPVRIAIAGGAIGVGWGQWLRATVWPVGAPMVLGTLVALPVHLTMQDGWPRYACVTAAYALSAIPLTWRLTVGAREKDLLSGLLRARLRRGVVT